MQLKKYSAPYISHPDSSRSIMFNVLISLIIIYVIAFYFYGPRALLLALVSVAACTITEAISLVCLRKKIRINDFSSVITGLLIPLMMPASVPFRVPIIAAIFAILIVKQPFGGTGNNIFNPAAAGYAFAISCFSPDIMFRYPQPLNFLPIFDLSSVSLFSSNTFTLSVHGIPTDNYLTIILGNHPGPMGATNLLVLFACLIFLLYSRAVSWHIPVTFLSTTTIFSMLFRRIPVSAFESAFYENTSGLIIFAAVFILSDPVTIPKRTFAKVSYSFITGIVVMLFSYFGRVQDSVMFSIIIMNSTTWILDVLFEKLAHLQRRKYFEVSSDAKISPKANT